MLRHFLILIALALAGVLACGCAGGQAESSTAEPVAGSPRLSAVQQPPATQPASQPASKPALIAAWSYCIIERPRRPIVWVYADGRVRMSRTLIAGGPIVEGRLTPRELEQFKTALTNMTDGLAGEKLFGTHSAHSPYHEFTIDLPGRAKTRMESLSRIVEPRWKDPVVYWSRRARVDGGEDRSRFKVLSEDFAPPEMAIRETFIAVEAEFLRAAGLALMNQVAPPATKPSDINPAQPIPRN